MSECLCKVVSDICVTLLVLTAHNQAALFPSLPSPPRYLPPSPPRGIHVLFHKNRHLVIGKHVPHTITLTTPPSPPSLLTFLPPSLAAFTCPSTKTAISSLVSTSHTPSQANTKNSSAGPRRWRWTSGRGMI